jgi:hypothetical protein
MTESTKPRTVSPRKWALIAATGIAAAQPALTSDLFVSMAMADQTAPAAEAGEGGEAGEAGVARSEGPSAYLTELGYFEGTYLIIAGLYLAGERDLARAHMEESHHAIYEDIAPKLAAMGAPEFASAADAFSTAVADDASDDQVAAAMDRLMAEVAAARAAANLPLGDQLISIQDLLTLAHAEYQGGVDQGEVVLAIEYRDSWGFYETARRRAEALAADADPVAAKAGQDMLARMAGLDALYPALTANTASTDAAPLAAAAGWAEIIGLRLK